MRENSTGTYNKEVNAALEEAKLNFEATPVGRAHELAAHQTADARSLSSAAMRGSTGESEASSLAKSKEAPRVSLTEFPEHPEDPVQVVRYSSEVGECLAGMRQTNSVNKADFKLAA